MFSPDLPIFTSLGYGVFVADDERTLKLKNPPVAWLPEYFGDRWDPEERVLRLEEHSVLETFLSYCLECDREGEELHEDKITFEESYVEGRHFVGQVTSYQIDGSLLFIIRKADDLDSVSRTEIQTLRKSALNRSNFSRAREHQSNHAIWNNFSDFGDGMALITAIISASPHPVLVLDKAHHLVMANSHAHNQFPTLPNSSDKPFESFYRATVSHQEAASLIAKVECGLTSAAISLWDVPLPYPQKVKVEVRPILQAGEEPQGSVWSFLPETGSGGHYLEEAFSETERAEVIGRLAGGVAHDFNNLLAIVLGNLAILNSDESVLRDAALSDSVSMASQAANKAAVLVRQLLGYSRKTRLEKAAVNVTGLIKDAVALCSSNAPDTFSIFSDLDDDAWDIHADQTQILQVLINIFDNALDATGGEGELHISARNFVLNNPEMCEAFDCNPGHYVIITMSDDGEGMTPEVREKVFEPFFTTKDHGSGAGTGLGMANALGIIRQHGGHISCTTAVDQGTTFSLYLPRYRIIEKVDRSRRPNFAEAVRNGNKTPGVLVVDDEELLRNLVRTLCEKNGYRTFGAADGQEAIEFIEDNRDELFTAVIDLAMPRMTGTELLRKMSQQGIELPVIVASGFLVDSDKFVEETGAAPYAIFSKPYHLNDLIEKIDELRDQAGLALPA